MRFFHSGTPDEETKARISVCLGNIKSNIANQRGDVNVMERDDWIAFAGSPEQPELLLTISAMKTGGKWYLYADIDDETSWHECDYESQADFENAIAEYIAPLIDRTVKTVTEKKKHKFIKITRYYLNDADEWTLMDEDICDAPIIRLFITKDSVSEEVKSYLCSL